jgi:hypothetical protein
MSCFIYSLNFAASTAATSSTTLSPLSATNYFEMRTVYSKLATTVSTNALKGQCHEILTFGFFHQAIPRA